MVTLNLTDKPLHSNRPELLLHPSIPRILSGVNPRTIKGQDWWGKIRRDVYKANNYHCEACGVYQLDAAYAPLLDAHETYTYDYEKFEARPGEIVALCRACHWFIHWRRVRQWKIRKEVVIRGLRFLTDAGLPVPYWQHRLASSYDWQWSEERYQNLDVQEKSVEEKSLFSRKWVLVLDEVKYSLGGKIGELQRT